MHFLQHIVLLEMPELSEVTFKLWIFCLVEMRRVKICLAEKDNLKIYNPLSYRTLISLYLTQKSYPKHFFYKLQINT